MKRASTSAWEKYGKQLITLSLLLVVYLFLEAGVTYSIETDKDTYSVGEVVNATVIVHNPLPLSVVEPRLM